MRVLETRRPRDRAAIERCITRDPSRNQAVARQAARIVADVRAGGDRAVLDWRRRLDGDRSPLIVDATAIEAGWRATAAEVRRAIRRAARHIARVAEAQRPPGFVVTPAPGVRIEQRVVPLDRTGCYVPGGRFPLPSTLLMTAIPARVAGVREVIVTCPNPSPVVLAAAREAGVTRIFRIGGAQAIAAMAYGTATVPRVDKIAGPGNAWVAAAKRLVAPDCAIDLHAGPSEIAIYSDAMRADWIAADLIAQAEHDSDARAIFVTTRVALARAVAAGLTRQATVIVARSHDEAIALINRIAPEHAVCDSPAIARTIVAGTIFVGRWSAQAAGDYATGSNHVLPTGGAARVRGGLSAADFVRSYTIQTLSRRGIRAVGPAAATLADAEGLAGHAASIRKRLQS
ncbi:MAG TPA: histidinol dehydrogenase [Vicinamibacterales bacterium]|nr:histidinol dehydrogenase [Vicinamibacterales bacterium]